jgi:hypothetical protein
MISAGFFTTVVGFFLSVPTPAFSSGTVQNPAMPAWYPYEMAAANLYMSGIYQESSDPEAALKTLRKAREDSTAAIVNGGGSNPIVMHNDSLIAQALTALQAGKPENKEAPVNSTNDSNNSVKPDGSYVRAIGVHTTTQPLARRSIR